MNEAGNQIKRRKYIAMLKLPKSFTREELMIAFRDRVRENHTDAGGDGVLDLNKLRKAKEFLLKETVK